MKSLLMTTVQNNEFNKLNQIIRGIDNNSKIKIYKNENIGAAEQI